MLQLLHVFFAWIVTCIDILYRDLFLFYTLHKRLGKEIATPIGEKQNMFDGLKILARNQIGYRACWCCGNMVEVHLHMCPKCNQPMRRPQIGDTVHYIGLDIQGEARTDCQPGVIAQIWKNSVVRLLVGMTSIEMVGWSTAGAGNSWHYKEDCTVIVPSMSGD